MTVYAVAPEVPEEKRDFLTAGKRYEAEERGGGFRLADDNEMVRYYMWNNSAYLNGKDWHRIETDAEGWATWEPEYTGHQPPDWQDGWEVQPVAYGKWWPTMTRTPRWFQGTKYRYRPAQAATEQPERPTADDYRDRAERAEAECEALKQRNRKLEALICDTLLENQR